MIPDNLPWVIFCIAQQKIYETCDSLWGSLEKFVFFISLKHIFIDRVKYADYEYQHVKYSKNLSMKKSMLSEMIVSFYIQFSDSISSPFIILISLVIANNTVST